MILKHFVPFRILLFSILYSTKIQEFCNVFFDKNLSVSGFLTTDAADLQIYAKDIISDIHGS